ncbi:MAG: hypothetical protein ACPLX7_09620 [Candidatus Kapaibacteriota bacterium]|jgi:hypothetical protein
MKKVKKSGILVFSLIFAFSLIMLAQDTLKTSSQTIDIEKAKNKFVEAKCNTCHAFSEFAIEAKNKSPNNKAPDLSKIKIDYDKEFLQKYLHKEEDINGKKHPVVFKGNDEDLQLIFGLMLLHQEPNNEKNKPEPENTKEENKQN